MQEREIKMKSKITYAINMYKKGDSEDTFQGITIMVDGDFRKELDVLLAKLPQYANYVDIINDAVFKGMSIIEQQAENARQ